MHRFSATGILLFTLLVLLGACGTGSQEGEKSTRSSGYKTFTYLNEGVEQKLQVKWQNDTAITFVLEHHQGDCNYTITGDAVNPYISYDPESDVDEETGEVYWVDLYLYNRNECRMAIRIAQDTTRAQLQLANCVASPTCAIKSVGLLRRE